MTHINVGTDTSTILPEVSAFYHKETVDLLFTGKYFNRFGRPSDSVPAKSGTLVSEWGYYDLLDADPDASLLEEGVTPDGDSVSRQLITATIQEYGNFTVMTKVLSFTSQDNVLQQTKDVIGELAGNVIDLATRNVITECDNVRYASADHSSRVTLDSTDIIDSATYINLAVNTLDRENCKLITNQINASVLIGTTPVQGGYIGLCHVDVSYDLRNTTGFVSVEAYSAQMEVFPDEIGKIGKVRFIETTNALIYEDEGAGDLNVYATLILSRHAYGTTYIGGEQFQTFLKTFGSGGTTDPLGQRATYGYRTTHASVILDQNRLVRIESTATVANS